MTLIFELDLDILPFDIHAKIQVRMSVRLAVRARQTDSHAHTDVGCNKCIIVNVEELPITVMDGLSRPSLSNVCCTSSLAKGLFGFGSFGVPSTRDQAPITPSQPTILYRIQQWSYNKSIH